MRKYGMWRMTNDPSNPHAEMLITAPSVQLAKKEYSKRNGNCPLTGIHVETCYDDITKIEWVRKALGGEDE